MTTGTNNPEKIGVKMVCGGQTGVDRAVLDFCLEKHIPCGGWCPDGRKAEDGRIDPKYPLEELTGGDYKDRTRSNVIDSDATVIIYHEKMAGGTFYSLDVARRQNKPYLILDMSELSVDEAAGRIPEFIERFAPGTLNFSGPRASQWDQGYSVTRKILQKAFSS